ncbi:uncharacterized protein V3H86_004442 isoform 1-T1 [Mergus octosetaceus]
MGASCRAGPGRRGVVPQRGESGSVGPPRRYLCSDCKWNPPKELGSCHHRLWQGRKLELLFQRKIDTSFVEMSKSVYIKAEQLGYWATTDCSIFTGQRWPHNSEQQSLGEVKSPCCRVVQKGERVVSPVSFLHQC